MSRRSIEEIKVSVRNAMDNDDAAELSRLADELRLLDTRESLAYEHHVRGAVGLFSGDYPNGLMEFDRAMDAYAILGDEKGAASVTGNMGVIYWNTGDYPRTLEYMQRAVDIHEKIGDMIGATRMISNIGAVNAELGDSKRALEYYDKARSLFKELKNDHGLAASTGNLGIVYSDKEEHHRAQELFNEALEIHTRLGDDAGIANVTSFLCKSYVKNGQLDKLEDIVPSFMEMDASVVRVQIGQLEAQAAISKHRGDADKSQELVEKALAVASRHGHRSTESSLHFRLREMAKERSDIDAYVLHNAKFEEIKEEVHGQQATRKIVAQESERELSAVREERGRERELLYATLPKHVVDRLVLGKDVTDHYDEASILFLDIVGYTSISASMTPEKVVLLLDTVFGICDRICAKYGVTKVITFGDSYLAVCGVPEPLEDHASRTARAAIDMMAELEVPVRIGLHTGPVTAGVVGKDRLQYDVWGDTLDVASSIESTSEPRKIHVSEAFVGSCGSQDDKFEFVERGEVEVKGRGTMRTFWLS